MTCEEFRIRIAPGRQAGEIDREAAGHMEICADCRRLADAEDEITSSLQMVREIAPAVPASLDLAVIAAYRKQFDRAAPSSMAVIPKSSQMIGRLAWAGLAAAVVIGAVLLMVNRKTGPPVRPTVATGRTAAVVPPEPPRVQRTLSVAQAAHAMAKKAHRPRMVRPAAHDTPTDAVARYTPSPGFQNLMYCDALSCSGAMEVIRIQVPASAINRVPAWQSTNGFVQADVVVGSDGVARAIRIVR